MTILKKITEPDWVLSITTNVLEKQDWLMPVNGLIALICRALALSNAS